MGNRELLKTLREFVAERNSQEFHFPEKPAQTIYIESNEVSEIFQWSEPFNIEKVKDSLADVLRLTIWRKI